jgi:hypothetical protein
MSRDSYYPPKAEDWSFLDQGGEMALVSTDVLRRLATQAIRNDGAGLNGGGPQGEDGSEYDGEPSAATWGDEPGGALPLVADEDEGPDPEMFAICDKIMSACDRLDQRMTAMERARRLDAAEDDCR